MAAGVVPYLLAMIQKVSPASTVTSLVLVAIVPPGTTATTTSQHAAKTKVIPEEVRILARTENVEAEDTEIMARSECVTERHQFLGCEPCAKLQEK